MCTTFFQCVQTRQVYRLLSPEQRLGHCVCALNLRYAGRAERFFRCVCMARRRRALDDDDPQDVRCYMQQQLQITLKREIARILLLGLLDFVQSSSVEPPKAYNIDGCDDIEKVLHALCADGEPIIQ